jgi:hypothetical protein
MFLTIAIPTRNRATLLQRALSSVLADQSEGFEVVVSDNCSTDETARVLSDQVDPRVRTIMQPAGLTMIENWRACLNAAAGEHILFLSDDDFVGPGFAGAILRAAGDVASASLAITESVVVRENVQSKPSRIFQEATKLSEEEFLYQVLSGRLYPQLCSVVFDTQRLRQRPFDDQLMYALDADAWIRQVDGRGVALLREARAYYALSLINTSSTLPVANRFNESHYLARLLRWRLRGKYPRLHLWARVERFLLMSALYLSSNGAKTRQALWVRAMQLNLSCRWAEWSRGTKRSVEP